jgi:succinate-acetate transporter protein
VKRKTDGVDPNVPVQALVTLLVAVLAYFGVDLDAEVAGALGVVVGAAAAYWAPAARTIVVRSKRPAVLEGRQGP